MFRNKMFTFWVNITPFDFTAGTTLAYVAPEIFTAKSDVVYASDIFSFGISMFEVLSDLPSPWSRHLPVCSDLFIKEAITRGERPNMDVLNSLYSSNIYEMIIKACWEEDMKTRPSSEEVYSLYY